MQTRQSRCNTGKPWSLDDPYRLSPKPSAEGSSPSAPATQKTRPSAWSFVWHREMQRTRGSRRVPGGRAERRLVKSPGNASRPRPAQPLDDSRAFLLPKPDPLRCTRTSLRGALAHGMLGSDLRKPALRRSSQRSFRFRGFRKGRENCISLAASPLRSEAFASDRAWLIAPAHFLLPFPNGSAASVWRGGAGEYRSFAPLE